MGECKLCNKKGFLFFVNENGLCSNCQSIVLNEIKQTMRVINDCVKLINESKNMKTRLSRCDVLLKCANDLLEYEKMGIPTINPNPSEFIADYTNTRDQIIMDDISINVEKLVMKSEIIGTSRAAINEINKAIIKIREGKKELLDQSKLDQIEQQVLNLKHKTQLNTYLDLAHKAEFKGQTKKALEQYQEALYFLQTDKIDNSLQKEKIDEIKAKISELSN